jgi:hypothetical protein
MRKRLAVVLSFVALVAGSAAFADEMGYRVYTTDGKFEDVRDDLKTAIINKGFVIDHVGLLNAMLERTGEVAGSVTSPYKNAEYLQFCPVKLTHEAVTATPLAIANCPISMFVFETGTDPGKIQVGYRLLPATPSPALRDVNARIEALLDSLAKEAVGR